MTRFPNSLHERNILDALDGVLVADDFWGEKNEPPVGYLRHKSLTGDKQTVSAGARTARSLRGEGTASDDRAGTCSRHVSNPTPILTG